MNGITWKDVVQTFAVILMAIIAFLGKELYSKQVELSNGQNALSSSVSERFHSLDVWRAEVQTSRFTVADWMRVKQEIDLSSANLDKRMTRAEDAFTDIMKKLSRIEDKMDQTKTISTY